MICNPNSQTVKHIDGLIHCVFTSWSPVSYICGYVLWLSIECEHDIIIEILKNKIDNSLLKSR